MSAFKFTIRNLKGERRWRVLVRERDLNVQQSAPGQKHHIIIVDRSGSMYYDMESLKQSLKKVLTLHEYHEEGILVSLMSYSSRGDLTTHFEKVPIEKVDVRIIDKLRATSLTCISQSLVAVKALIDPNQVTGITLHSDGYANDPSSFIEKKAIVEACAELAKQNVFVNTVSHSEYADYQLLSNIANRVSGKCVQANKVKELYDSIVGTFENLVSGTSSKVTVKLDGDDYLVYIGYDENKIIGCDEDMVLAGIDGKSPGTVWGFKTVIGKEYDDTRIPEVQTHDAIYGLCRARLAEGNVNEAKYILASTGNVTLFNKHWRSASATQMALMAMDIEAMTFGKTNATIQSSPIVVDDSLTVLSVLSTIDTYKDSISIHLSRFLDKYHRRGLKRIPGTRDETGRIIDPSYQTLNVGDAEFCEISGLDISTTSANVSITTTRKVRLIQRGSGQPIYRVAGINIDPLTEYKSYNIIADGELTTSEIPVCISQKTAFEALKELGVLFFNGKQVKDFDHRQIYTIVLDSLPITQIDLDFGDTSVIKKLFVAKILTSVAEAATKDVSDKYTPEQIAELKEHCLSSSLYLNFPTINEYEDLEIAIAEGKVDVRSAFKVKFGIDGILGFDSFRSANEFLKRRFDPVAEDGTKPNKVSCDLLLETGKYVYEKKALSKRAKETAADVFQEKVFDALLGETSKRGSDYKEVLNVLRDAGAEKLVQELSHVGSLGHGDSTKTSEALVEAKRKLNDYFNKVYMENIFPVLFFIGSFGMTPDDWNAKAMSADELKQIWPEAKIGKSESDGVFFKAGDVVFGVTSERRYVTIDR